MTTYALKPMLGMLDLSGGDLVITLVFILALVATLGAIIALVLWLARRNARPIAAPPRLPPPPAAPTKRVCPQCGKEMSTDATQGLCPACLLKVGLGTETGGPDEAKREPAAAPTPAEIAKHFPQLEILELLGQGGMGMVYKARQPQLDRFIALKILSPHLSRDPAFAERFNREAKALARLNHPNIVGVFDFGKAGEFYYFLMEFVDGLNLSQMERVEKRVAPEQALAIVPKICDALQYAHDEGVVHRDIKPGNILVDRKGRVKIADFGLAKLAGQDREDFSITQSRMTLGTPQYMAPEQFEDPQKVDHRADIYSLGVVFYEMLTGELPMGRFAPPSQRVQVDLRLDEVVLHALEREPGRRYQHASVLRTDVEAIAKFSKSEPRVSNSGLAAGAPPRFSRMAIVGMCWMMPLFFIAFVWLLSAKVEGKAREPIWWDVLLTNVVSLTCFIAPLGTTILGWLAVSQIRRSPGKLRGMWLAVFEGLCFPLLALDGVIIGTVIVGLRLSDQEVQRSMASPVGIPILILVPVVLGIIALVDFLIIRRVWRAVNKPPQNGPTIAASVGEVKAEQSRGWPFVIAVSSPLIAGAVLLTVAISVSKKNAAEAQQAEQNQLQVAVTGIVGRDLGSRRISYDRFAFQRLYDMPRASISFDGLRRASGTYGVSYPLRGLILLRFDRPNQCDVSGTLDLADIRYSFPVATSSGRWWPTTNTATMAPHPAWTFGPVIERVIHSVTPKGSIRPLDLDSGEEVELPAGLEGESQERLFALITDRGLDLMGRSNPDSWTLTTSLKLASLPGSAWVQATPETLRKVLSAGTNALPRQDIIFDYDQYALASNTPLPLSFAFQTRAGGFGLLQITAFTENPRGVKIRYKVAKPESATGPEKYVRLFVAPFPQFEGRSLGFPFDPAILEDAMDEVPDRAHTIVEIAKQNEWPLNEHDENVRSNALYLVKKLGFASVREIGLRPVGTKGSRPLEPLMAGQIASDDPNWFITGNEKTYVWSGTDSEIHHSGKSSLSLMRHGGADTNDWSMVLQVREPGGLRGKRVRFSAYVVAPEIKGWAGLRMQANGNSKLPRPLALDNMEKRPIKQSGDWRKYKIVLDVPEQTEQISFGLQLTGNGTLRMDDFNFEIVGKDVEVTDMMPALYPASAPEVEIPNISAKPTVPLTETRPAAAAFGPVVERLIQARETGTNSFLDLDTGRLLTPPPEVTTSTNPFLDLDTGQLLAPPPEAAGVRAEAESAGDAERSGQALDIPRDSRRLRYIAWLRESGADLMFNSQRQLLGFDAVFPIVRSVNATNRDDWDRLTPEQVRAAVDVVGWNRRAAEAIRAGRPVPPNPGAIYASAAQMGSPWGGGPVVHLLTPEQSVTWFFETREGGAGVLQIVGFTEIPLGVQIRYKLMLDRPAPQAIPLAREK